MLSKYHAVLLPAGALLHMVFWPQARRCLRKPGPYLAAAIGLILFSPVIAWNATHDWASFLFQGGRASVSHQLRLDQLGATLGIEALLPVPVALARHDRITRQAHPARASRLGQERVVSDVPGRTGARVVPCDRRTAVDHALLAAVRLHRTHAAPGTSLGRRSRKPAPSGSANADHRRHAVPGRCWRPSPSPRPRFGLLEDSQGRLLGLIAPKHDLDRGHDLLGRGRNRARATRAPHRAANLPVHRLLGSQRRARPRHARQSPGGVLPPRTPELHILEPSRRLGGPRRDLRRDRPSSRRHLALQRVSSSDMNRSAPCESSAAAFSFARSISTAAPIRSGRSRSTAASRSSPKRSGTTAS